MFELLQKPANLGLVIAMLVAVALYIRERRRRKKLQSESDKFLQEIREKGWETLNQSIKKSQAILGQAELEGVKVIADSKIQTSQMEDEYSRKLSETLDQSRHNINTAQTQLLQFMQSLQQKSAELHEANQKAAETRINELLGKVETRLSDFLMQTEQKTTSSIELELRSIRQLIETYKNQQLALIDENIIAMMEQTLSLVLAKKMTLNDQLDLVYEALEKAKVEKFIV